MTVLYFTGIYYVWLWDVLADYQSCWCNLSYIPIDYAFSSNRLRTVHAERVWITCSFSIACQIQSLHINIGVKLELALQLVTATPETNFWILDHITPYHRSLCLEIRYPLGNTSALALTDWCIGRQCSGMT